MIIAQETSKYENYPIVKYRNYKKKNADETFELIWLSSNVSQEFVRCNISRTFTCYTIYKESKGVRK